MSVEFFRLIEARSPEDIAEEMKYAFGPSKGQMSHLSVLELTRVPEGHEPLLVIFDEAKEPIPDDVFEAMERLGARMRDNLLTSVGLPKEYANEKENTSALVVL